MSLRYRIIAPLPAVLEYRAARYFLEARATMGAAAMFARKDSPTWAAAVLWRANYVEQLDAAGRSGFDVEEGSPADRIMKRLMSDGFAERIDGGQHSGGSSRGSPMAHGSGN